MHARPIAAATALALFGGCTRGSSDPDRMVVARFAGGEITAAEVQRDASRLPPVLREQFETRNGRREFIGAMIDKRLLFLEARRLEFTEDPEVQRQVRELEERLAVQALLAAEEKRLGPVSDSEARAYFESHRSELEQPERVRVGRVLARVPPGSDGVLADARARAGRLGERLRRGEPLATIAREGDGPEASRGGDYGVVARGGTHEAAVVEAAFALRRPGEVSPVVRTREGYAVLQLLERLPARSPAFEEVRAEVENRILPERKRKAFDGLLARLRQGAEIHIGD